MAKDKEIKTNARKVEKPLNRLNDLFNSLLDRATGNSQQRGRQLDALIDEAEDIVDEDLEGMVRFTGDDISTYLVKLFNDFDNRDMGGKEINGIEDIFSNDSGAVFALFQERYRNQNLLYEDLASICANLPELMEAVNATRDAIVTADDLTQSVARTIKIKNHTQDNDDRRGLTSLIEKVETKFKLTERIKDHIVPNTLKYGKYYVYTVPYAKMFEQHYKQKIKDQSKGVRESADVVQLESFTVTDIKDIMKSNEWAPQEIKSFENVTTSLNHMAKDIQVYTDDNMSIPLVENSHFGAFMEDKFKKQVDVITKAKAKEKKQFNDGTVDLNEKDMDFSSIKDCYVQLIDPTRLIPIKILDEVIGYYYIHQKDIDTTRSPFSTSIKLKPTQDHKNVETAFLAKITDKIVKAFDRKYLEENSKFKDLILNSLIFNDVYKKQIKFQFIPVDYITEFAVNRDELGEGTSVLYQSLFYAKLFLSLMIFNIMTIISRSNDTRVYYVQNSGVDQNMSNKTQEAARTIKDRQMNFMDLLNYNSMMGKLGHAKDLFIPIGQGGEQSIKFDILAGQNVQLNTELTDSLRTTAINSTGVPAVIATYSNEVDYARTLVMANTKFLLRVVKYQLELNPSITELYRKLLRFTTDMEDVDIESTEILLVTPKALSANTSAELINNSDQVLKFMMDVESGINGQQDEDDNVLRDITYNMLAREVMPSLPWKTLDEVREKAKIEMSRRKEEDKAKAATSSTEQM